MPATLADVNVDKTPQKSAETATRKTSAPRLGASCDSTPIWMPSELMFPKP